MRPIELTTQVPQSRRSVYDFLDVMANHELFTDHFMRDWSCSGPERGIGARAAVTNVLGGQKVPVEIEVVEAADGVRSSERNLSAGGRRVGRGTYELADLPDGGTAVTFRYEWERAPIEDRLLAPVIRPMMRRAFRRALDRLSEELAGRGAPAPDRRETGAAV
jgi:hypothetical protein